MLMAQTLNKLSVTVQAGRGGAHRHRGLRRADRGERLHEHRANLDLGQSHQVGPGKLSTGWSIPSDSWVGLTLNYRVIHS